jgi:fluoride ion exporter CrcB/FEX
MVAMTLLFVTVAGAFGCVIRFLMEYVLANVVGTGIAGYVAYRLASVSDVQWRSVLLTGFCGGLTTFSSAFAIPAVMQREHHWRYSLTLVLTTPLLSAGAFVVGTSFAH